MESISTPQIISIIITNFQILPQIRGGYVRYSITVTGTTRFLHSRSKLTNQTFPSFSIYSRYTQLLQFHHQLKTFFPSLPIPKFPPKKIFRNKNKKFIQKRILKINQYFFLILKIPQIHSCQPLLKLIAPWSPVQLLVLQCAQTGSQRLIQDFLQKSPLQFPNTQITSNQKISTQSIFQSLPVDLIIKQRLYRISEIKRIKYVNSKNPFQFVKQNCHDKNGVIFCYNSTDPKSQQIAFYLHQTFLEILPCIIFNTDYSNPESASAVFLALVKLTKIEKIQQMADWKLISLLMIGMIRTLVQSFFPAIIPLVSKEKGIQQIFTGLIISMYFCSAFLIAPLIDRLIAKIGAKRIMVISTFFMIVTMILLGTLEYYGGTGLIVIGIVVRLFAGAAGAGILVTQFALLSILYKDDLPKVIGIQQSLNGGAMILGLLVGSVLYFLGGLILVFMIFSFFSIGILLVLQKSLPQDSQIGAQKNSWVSLLKVRTALMNSFLLLAIVCLVSGIMPLLAIFIIEDLKQDEWTVPFIISLPILSFSVSSLVTNKGLKYIRPKGMMFIGCLIFALSQVVIGPVSFIGLKSNVILTCGAILLQGAGFATVVIPLVPDLLDDVQIALPSLGIKRISEQAGVLVMLAMLMGSFFGPLIGESLIYSMKFGDIAGVFGGFLFLFSLVYGVFGGGIAALKIEEKEEYTEIKELVNY